MNPEEQKKLYDFVRSLYPLQEEEVQAFCQGWQAMTLKRKTVLTVAGTTEKQLYFVLEGVQRAFYLDDNNKEATIVFT